jgi:hypothetical protein
MTRPLNESADMNRSAENDGRDPATDASTIDASTIDASTIDIDTVMAQIMAEAALRRRDGTYPADLERSLAATFARFAPPGALGNDLGALLDRVDQAGVIDADVPTESARAGMPYVKKAVRKSTGWYQRYVTQQVTGFAHVTARTLRALAARVDEVADATPTTSAAVQRFVATRPTSDDDEVVRQLIVSELRDRSLPGRTAHLGAGPGHLVADLAAVGVDVYGVDVTRSARRRASIIEMRQEDPRLHAERLAPGALGAVVLTHWLDVAASGHRVAMISRANELIAHHGVLVLAITDGVSMDRHYDAAMLEVLGVARWSIDTWIAVVSASGWPVIERRDIGDGRSVVIATR